MRRYQTIPRSKQRIASVCRLDNKHVEPSTVDASLIKRIGKILLHHDGAARGVDQDRCRFHPRQPLAINQPQRAGLKRTMQRHDIGITKQLFQGNELHVRSLWRGASATRRGHDLHAKGLCHLGNLLPDSAIADQAQCFTLKLNQRLQRKREVGS
ncbi:hypothetical protein D3C73_1167970 [compost metagenome]